jgi:ketosteroid isomerase-like protein
MIRAAVVLAIMAAVCLVVALPWYVLVMLRNGRVVFDELIWKHHFQRFVSDEGIFFGSGNTPLRGKAAVAAFWKKFYEQPAAPFSWEPELVQVLDSGTLALSSGPVRDASGKHFANFQSIWRQESPGVWRVVFDKGERVCDCASKP